MIMSYHLNILIYPEKNLNPLKNLNHHDKIPAAPVQGNNLTLMKKNITGPQRISQPLLTKYFNPTPGKNFTMHWNRNLTL